MSRVGMPSVMHTTSAIPASAASMTASAALGGGTKTMETFAPVVRTACSTLSNSGKPSIVVPPLPGVTPPTTFVPYSRQPMAWKVPCLPMPCTSSRVSLPTSTLMAGSPDGPRGRHHLARGVGHVVGGREVEARGPQHLLALLLVVPFHADDHRDLDAQVAHGGDHALGQDVAAQDAAEDVDEDGLHLGVGQEDAERALDLVRAGPAAHVQEVGGAAAGQLDD